MNQASKGSPETLLPTRSGAADAFHRIQESILAGTYAYKERLPSEQELAIRFRIARGTIRSVLEQLEQAGLVQRKFGSGTFVTYRNDTDRRDIAEKTSPLELIEARMVIEPHIVRLTILHASNHDLNELEAVLKQGEGTENDPDAFSKADEAFHMALANCCQNPLLKWISRLINDIRSHSQWSARKDHILTPVRIRFYHQDHQRLLAAIRRRDQNLAAKIVNSHLAQAHRDLLGPD